MLAILYLILPAWWQWSSNVKPAVREVQTLISPPPEKAALVRELRTIHSSAQGAPVILTYHDVVDHPELYSVTPKAFASQMQLLHDANYKTLTAAQLVAWLHGTPVPPHSLAITFDDGATGVWKYADPILARYGFHAIAFVITGFVGTHQPYYMTWPQIEYLESTHRWDIESHTNRGHVYVVTNALGGRGPFLTSLRYLAAQHRSETINEYASRIKTDLAESKEILISHGIPSPQLFAYPFSSYEGIPQISHILHRVIGADFRAAMLDESGGSAVTSVVDVAAHDLHRVDVTRGNDLATWTANIRAASPLSPAKVLPLSLHDSWTAANDQPVRMKVHGGWATLRPGPGKWLGRLFSRSRTSLWRQYTVRGELGGLGRRGDGTTAGLRVLSDDPQQVQVTVSAGYYEIRQGLDNSEHLLARGDLPQESRYSVAIDVMPKTVRVLVAGHPVKVIELYKTDGEMPAGGIELTGQRRSRTSPLPRFGHLKISEGSGDSLRLPAAVWLGF